MKTWALCSAVNPGNWKKENWHDSVRKIPFEFHFIIMTPQCQYVEQCIVTVSITSALQAETVLFRNIAFHFCLWTCSHCKFAVTSKCHWNGNCSELCRSCYVYIILQCRTRWALCLDLSSSGKTNTAVRFFWNPHPRRFRCDQFMLKIPT